MPWWYHPNVFITLHNPCWPDTALHNHRTTETEPNEVIEEDFQKETRGCSIWWGSIKYWAGFPSLSGIRKRTRWAEDITVGLSNRHEYRQTACVKLSISNRDSGRERASTTAFSIQQRPNYQLTWYVNDASPRNTENKNYFHILSVHGMHGNKTLRHEHIWSG